MKKNVGTIDKLIRIVLALVFFSFYFLLEGNLKFIAVIGLVPLMTAMFSFCPLYTLIGFNTCKLKK